MNYYPYQNTLIKSNLYKYDVDYRTFINYQSYKNHSDFCDFNPSKIIQYHNNLLNDITKKLNLPISEVINTAKDIDWYIFEIIKKFPSDIFSQKNRPGSHGCGGEYIPGPTIITYGGLRGIIENNKLRISDYKINTDFDYPDKMIYLKDEIRWQHESSVDAMRYYNLNRVPSESLVKLTPEYKSQFIEAKLKVEYNNNIQNNVITDSKLRNLWFNIMAFYEYKCTELINYFNHTGSYYEYKIKQENIKKQDEIKKIYELKEIEEKHRLENSKKKENEINLLNNIIKEFKSKIDDTFDNNDIKYIINYVINKIDHKDEINIKYLFPKSEGDILKALQLINEYAEIHKIRPEDVIEIFTVHLEFTKESKYLNDHPNIKIDSKNNRCLNKQNNLQIKHPLFKIMK